MVYLETSRGCPFSCGFCLSGRPSGVRAFDTKQAKRNLIQLAHTGAKTVKLVDRTFNCHPARSRELIHFLLESRESGAIPSTVCFHLEVAADLFDRETIGLLRAAPAGLFQLEIGIQSFREETLEAVGRKTDLDKVRKNVWLLREKNNIHLHLDLIAGLPGESYESFGRSFDEAAALSPHMLQLGFLKLLHGSRLREQSGRYGIVFDPQPPYRVCRTTWIDERELAALEACEDALDRLYNSGRFPSTWEYMRAAAGFTPFPFFSAIGGFIGPSAGMPLETYIGKILAFGGSLPGADREILRDHLVVDWLGANRIGVLPVVLKRDDPLNGRMEKALERWNKDSAGVPGLGTRRAYGFGLLYGSGKTRVALADYRLPKPVLGAYPLRIGGPEEFL